MKLIVCLGNPGSRYEYHRHNAGFLAGERLIAHYHLQPQGKKYHAELYKGVVEGQDVLLIKPLRYMNLSGQPTQSVMHYFRIPLKHLLVIYDDIDLVFGRLKLKAKGSAGTHNGMKSIVQSLGSAFARLRIGIGPKASHLPLDAFVLSDFTAEEQAQLPTVFQHLCDGVTCWLKYGNEIAMNSINSCNPHG